MGSNKLEQKRSVLRLFYEEGAEAMTPSYLVYRMEMTAEEATELLDVMVNEGILELESDDEGQLHYQLPAAERARVEQLREAGLLKPAAPTAEHSGGGGHGDASALNAPPSRGFYPQPVPQGGFPVYYPPAPAWQVGPPVPVGDPTHSPGLAVFLSAIFPGAGQFYNGQIGKGFVMLVGCVVLWIILLGWVVWIWSIVDAHKVAKARHLGR